MPKQSLIEALESRVLLSATTTVVTSVVADNRGHVSIYFSGPLMASTVNTNSVIMYTSNNVQLPCGVGYGPGMDRIIVSYPLPAGSFYYVAVRATMVKDLAGNAIDGEFTGTFPSGNGVPGGNFRFNAYAVPINQQIVNFSFTGGTRINVKLYSDASLPLTIPNFLQYVNAGAYDGTFLHRTATTAQAGCNIVQGGAFYVQNDPVLGENLPGSYIAQEPVYSNAEGTLAMANMGSANTTGNQWYFNVTANTDLDGGYSVFGAITNSSGQAVLQNIFSNTQQLDLSSTIDNNGDSRYGNDSSLVGQLTAVPTFNQSATAATADPASDFIIVTRVAVKNAVVPAGAPSPFLASQVRTNAVFAAEPITSSASSAPLNSSNADQALLSSDKLKL